MIRGRKGRKEKTSGQAEGKANEGRAAQGERKRDERRGKERMREEIVKQESGWTGRKWLKTMEEEKMGRDKVFHGRRAYRIAEKCASFKREKERERERPI